MESSFKPLSPSADSPLMYPIVEMSGFHSMFIPDKSYIWNAANPISQGHINGNKQLEVNRLVTTWEKYSPLASPLISPGNLYKDCNADLLIFSIDNPLHCFTLVKSCLANISNLNKIYLLYESCENNKNTYEEINRLSSCIQLVQIDENSSKLNVIFEKLRNELEEHVIISDDNYCAHSPIDVSWCIQELERTFAIWIVSFKKYRKRAYS